MTRRVTNNLSKRHTAMAGFEKGLEKLHAQIRLELTGRTLLDTAEIIQQERLKRSEQLLNTILGDDQCASEAEKRGS